MGNQGFAGGGPGGHSAGGTQEIATGYFSGHRCPPRERDSFGNRVTLYRTPRSAFPTDLPISSLFEPQHDVLQGANRQLHPPGLNGHRLVGQHIVGAELGRLLELRQVERDVGLTGLMRRCSQ